MSADENNDQAQPLDLAVDRGVRPPVRAFRLTLKIGADSRKEMVNSLMHLARRIDREELSGSGVWGGYSDGGLWELLTDPAMTHDRFFDELNQYLESTQEQPGPNVKMEAPKVASIGS